MNSRESASTKRRSLSIALIFLVSLYSVTTFIAENFDLIGFVAGDRLRNSARDHHYSMSGFAAKLHDGLRSQEQQQQNLQSGSTDLNNMQGYMNTENTDSVDRYIVALREGSSGKDRTAIIEEIRKRSTLNQENAPPQVTDLYNDVFVGFSISIPKIDTSILKAMQNNPRVAITEKDQEVYMFAQTLPTGINRVDGDLSITESGNGHGIVEADIAIMDTGVDLNHPDLDIYRERTFVSGTTSADDDDGHGTHVAGIAAAKDNSIGVVGIAPGARIWAIKVLDNTGTGFISDIIAGIDYLTQNAEEVDVVNMSFGCECSSSALDTALNNSVEAGIVYVAAAGNNDSDASTYSPANNVNVIAVSAIVDTDGKCGVQGPSTTAGRDDTFASFSNFGATVDFAAPGVLIYSTYIDGTYSTMSGTSMASPHVAGAAALIKSIQADASPSEIKNSLTSTGSKPSTICDGSGHGYFTGDPDQTHEPLLYLKHQASPLLHVLATQTNNLVNIKSYYDIWFRTSTAGTIKTVEIDFPEGTYIGIALLVEAVGIGPGHISRDNSDDTITYTVTNPVNVPASQNVRIQLSNINNPSLPSDSLTVTITTKNAAGNVIDGPTLSRQYLIKQPD